MNEVEMWMKDVDRGRKKKMAENIVIDIMEMANNLSDEMIIALLYALSNELVDRKISRN